MAAVADRRRGDNVGGRVGALAARTIIPALYGAALLAHTFTPDSARNPWVLAIIAGFLGHFLWRIRRLVAAPQAQDLERAEVGLLAVLTLSTALEILQLPAPWPLAANAVLLVSLSGSVPLPEILALPLATLFVSWQRPGFLADLVLLEVLAASAGAVVAVEKRRGRKLQLALKKLKLDAEHLEARAENAPTGKKGDLSRLDDVLYAYLEEVKTNAEAHGAVLALKTPKGDLYVRELVSDSHNIHESGVLSLGGTAFQWILKNKKPLRTGHLSDASARLGYYSGSVAVRSFVGVPLFEGEEVEGVLALDSLKEDAFNDGHLTMLRVASHQVATILTQLRALEQVKREARDFKSLHEFSKRLSGCNTIPDLLDLVLTVVRDRIQPDFSAAILDAGEGKLSVEAIGASDWAGLRGQSFAATDGLAGWVLSSRQYLHYGDLRDRARRPVFAKEVKVPEFQSLLLHPLDAHDQAMGVLCLGAASPRAFDSSAVAFCDILSQQTAQAILQIRAHKQLEELASTDALTGLHNRRFLLERLEEEVKRVRRYGPPLSLLLLDVDHFKKTNDRLGHPAGDEVLKSISRALKSFARETDLVARHGGEEFAILLPSTDEQGARTVAERVRQEIERLEIVWEGKTIPARVSLGVTALEGEDDTAEQMVSRADQSLYAAKETGRNRVITFSEIREYASWK